MASLFRIGLVGLCCIAAANDSHAAGGRRPVTGVVGVFGSHSTALGNRSSGGALYGSPPNLAASIPRQMGSRGTAGTSQSGGVPGFGMSGNTSLPGIGATGMGMSGMTGLSGMSTSGIGNMGMNQKPRTAKKHGGKSQRSNGIPQSSAGTSGSAARKK